MEKISSRIYRIRERYECRDTNGLYAVLSNRLAYGKKADESIPQLDEWLDSFEDGFPVIDLLQELMPLIQANFKSNLNKPKPKKSKSR